ncbi:hypothetical protein HK102_010836 [Quaeritorhiza haematococci]|nr:hypothetical protein HK102_010836 [Quaeritorhiza haematococci]
MFLRTPLRRATTSLHASVRFQSQIRTKTSLLPPNVSSLKELGKLSSTYPQAHPELFARMKTFYGRIAKGPKVQTTSNTFWGRYYDNYIAKDSFVPILHFIGVMIPIGYYLAYFKGGHYHPRREFH